jgi:putative tryptophan/tyrosine transport system substrate-binding protein
MRRRTLIALLGAAGAWPLAARAQQPSAKIVRIGYLMQRSERLDFDDAFLAGLRELGYVDGRNLAIEYRWAGGGERLAALAADLVAAKVNLIVTQGAAATLAAKNATATIPIVMASSQNAVGDGLVASLSRPGGNVTGRSLYAPELTPKRLELLKETVPGLSHVALLWNVQNPGGAAQFEEAELAARTLGLAISSLDIRIPDELDEALAGAVRKGAGALLVLSDSRTIGHRSQIAAAAVRHGLATMYANKDYVEGGGLMSYGPDLKESFRLAAIHVDKILKGAKPADLPVEQPTHFSLVINLKAARALGLVVSPTLLARADEVIE